MNHSQVRLKAENGARRLSLLLPPDDGPAGAHTAGDPGRQRFRDCALAETSALIFDDLARPGHLFDRSNLVCLASVLVTRANVFNEAFPQSIELALHNNFLP